MIRINLLGTPKKKGRRSSASVPTFAGEGPNLMVVLLVVVALTAAANGAWWWKLTRDGHKIEADLATAEAENRRLYEVKQRYLERERQRNEFKRRVDVIDQLRSNQKGPATLLTAMADTVNRTDGVWLSALSDDGTNISIKGVALSVHSVADLMHNLQATGYFKDVEIKETFQDERVKDMQAFNFTLTCAKAQKS